MKDQGTSNVYKVLKSKKSIKIHRSVFLKEEMANQVITLKEENVPYSSASTPHAPTPCPFSDAVPNRRPMKNDKVTLSALQMDVDNLLLKLQTDIDELVVSYREKISKLILLYEHNVSDTGESV